MAPRGYVLGYYPAWRSGLAPAGIDYRAFTHLAVAFASPLPDGGIARSPLLASRAVTGRAHRHGVKVLLSLGGGGSASDGAAAEGGEDVDFHEEKYCGSCHDGKTSFAVQKNCGRCHEAKKS